MIFRGVDVVVRRAVDDRVGTRPLHRRRHRRIVGDVEVDVAERDDLMGRSAFVYDRGRELPARADDRNPHQAALDEPEASNARIRSSSNTPSQRATTAVAMQLPMTLTAVRPMSIT